VIDWSVFDGLSESTCMCRCGTVFRSHSKLAAVEPSGFVLTIRRPCPACGRNDNVSSARSDWEEYKIGSGETGWIR